MKRVWGWMLLGITTLAGLAASHRSQMLENGSVKPSPGAAFARLPLLFEENHGQSPSEAEFLVRGRGYSR